MSNEPQKTEAAAVSNLLGNKDSVTAVKAVLGGQRKVFDSFSEATAKVQAITAKLAELGDSTELPVMAAGAGDLSKIETLDDERIAWAKSDMKVAVGLIGMKRPANQGGMAIRGIVVYPQPTAQQYMATEAGADWLEKITGKETGHVAFRHLRNVDSNANPEALFQTAMRIPVTAAEFAEEQRATGLDTSAFDAVWKTLRKMLVDTFPKLKDSLPAKGAILNCIRSTSYAKAEFEDLEEQGLFAFIGKAAIEMVDSLEESELDSSEIESWVTARDSVDIRAPERKELTDKLDLSKFSLAG